jgi:hypothetical protein
MANFRLVLRSGPTPGKVYPIDKAEAFIGRDVGNEIVINDSEVSRRHVRVFMQGANIVLEDLGSTNGTSVNGLFGPYVLRPGEIITLGEHISLVFEVSVDPESTVAAARQPATPAPVYNPPPPQPQPVYQAPSPPPVSYAGQVPIQPPPTPPQQKKGASPLVIVLLILLLLIICVCLVVVGFYLWNAPVSFWCQIPILNTTVFTCP